MIDPSLVSGPVGERLTIPTHISPVGGQTTHPSVVFVPEGWNGYRYWLAHTPYPGSDDAHEDPNVAASDDGVTWVVPDGLTNPLDDQPGTPTAYNSDVDLRLGPGNVMFLFWRTYSVSTPGVEETIYYRASSDGVTWTTKTIVYQTSHTTHRLLSPSLLFEDGRWVMWAVDAVAEPFRVVQLQGGPTPESAWTAPTPVAMPPLPAGRQPWHLNIIPDQGAYVGLLTDTAQGGGGADGLLTFISSDDGFSWATSPTTVIPQVQENEHNNLYRATLLREGTGFRVWYSAYLTAGTIWNIYRTFLTVQGTGPGPDPEGPGTPDVGVARAVTSVTWLGCDLVTGRTIAELPDMSGAVSRVLGAATSSSLELPIPLAGPAALRGAAFQATEPGTTMIVAVVNDLPTWGGIVLTREGGTDATLRLGCVSLEGYLDRRYVRDHAWTQRDAVSVVAAGLIGDANVNGIGLEVDAPRSGLNIDRTYLDQDDATVYRRLGELMKVTDGPEWTIDLDWADDTRQVVRKIIRVRARIGAAATSPNAVFSTQGSAGTRYTYREDYSDGRGANHIMATSIGEGEDRPQSTPAVEVQPGWPRYERRFSPSTSITTKSVLDGHASAELARRVWGAKTWQLETRWDASPRLNVDWQLGDDVGWELAGHRHPQGVTGVGRVIGWELDMRQGIVKPLLWQPDNETGAA